MELFRLVFGFSYEVIERFQLPAALQIFAIKALTKFFDKIFCLLILHDDSFLFLTLVLSSLVEFRVNPIYSPETSP
jgi:hypothetical protein